MQACQNVCLIVKKTKKDDKKSLVSLTETVNKVIGGHQSTTLPSAGEDRATRAKRRREAKETKIEEAKKEPEEEKGNA